jgi:DNA polymerase-3 subunit alpha
MSFFEENNIEVKKQGALFVINGIKMLWLDQSKTVVDGKPNVTESQKQMFFINGDAEAVLIKPAETPYYAVFDKEKREFGDLKVLLFNNSLKDIDETPILGIKTKYSIMDSSLDMKNAVKIAKKTGIKSLGICDNSCLGGVLEFQNYCLAEDIKPILGVEYKVRFKNNVIPLKFYGKYRDLLSLNKIVMVDRWNTCVLESSDLTFTSDDLRVVINPTFIEYDQDLVDLLNSNFNSVYYQFSTTEYISPKVFSKSLSRLKKYLKSEVSPIWINDTYYTHKFYKDSKILLNKMVDGRSTKKSNNQEFRTATASRKEFEWALVSEEANKEFDLAINNAILLSDSLPDVPINTEGFKIPKFLDSPEEEYELFRQEIGKGWREKIETNKSLDKSVYIERVKKEMEVIKNNNFVSYFLITKSQYDEAKRIGAYVGRGRGSGAGSLVTYLMDITQVDPIQHNLSFERFLNEGRATKSMPDLDCDFEKRKVNKIKEFLMNRYGRDSVALIGSFGELTAKKSITTLAKLYGETDQNTRYHSKIIKDGKTMSEVFGSVNDKLVKFFDKNYEAVSQVEKVEGALAQKGVHACGVLVTPKEWEGESMNIWDFVPVRKIKYEGFDEPILITEFNGKSCESMGLLKNDILSLASLDVIHDVVELIKEKRGVELDYLNFPTFCKDTFNNFAEGKTCNVFQFASPVATSYVRKAKPASITELSIITSLLRPATMSMDIHTQYNEVKNGLRDAEYDLLLEDIEEETLGFLVFQEQVMKAFVVLAGFTDAQADDVRRAIGKKDMEAMKGFKIKFLEGSIEKGYNTAMANQLWDKILEFSTYSFNKSHALSYAWASYDTMYLKTHYPSEFYAVALGREYAKSKENRNMSSIIKEIQEEGIISIKTPDINKSLQVFDVNDSQIYWGLSQIKGVKSLVPSIISERECNGDFLSIIDFVNRMSPEVVTSPSVVRKAKKNEIEALIMSGAFDELEHVKSVFDRGAIIKKFYDHKRVKESDRKYQTNKFAEYKMYEQEMIDWTYVDYENLISVSNLDIDDYFTASEMQDLDEGDTITVAGIIKTITKKQNHYGGMISIALESNSDLIQLTGFDSFLNKNKAIVKKMTKGSFIFISGVVKFDDWRGKYVLNINHKSKVTFIYENRKK